MKNGMILNNYLLAIDAGFANTGVALLSIPDFKIQSVKVIVTKKDTKKKNLRVSNDDVRRVKETLNGLHNTFPILHNIFGSGRLFGVVEIPHGGAKGARANRTMGMATATAVSFFEIHSIPFEDIPPGDIKKQVAGKFNASKDAVREGVRNYFRGQLDEFDKAMSCLPERLWEHVYDALGASFWFKENSEFYKIVKNRND